MKILIINPNSDGRMTGTIQRQAEKYAGKAFEVVSKDIAGSPLFISTYEDRVKTAAAMKEMVLENQDAFDGFIVACHGDPNLDLLKEITAKPVVGIGEASMKIATMLGHRFSVVSLAEQAVPHKECLARSYHLQDLMTSVRCTGKTDLNDPGIIEAVYLAGKRAVEEDNAEVIVLGCAGMAGMEKVIEKKLGVPVLDGVACALIICTGFVRYGLSTSKIRRYKPAVL